ncbi:unnamed protein product [Adineta steineri]|uniref:Protein kinase domain-containing protein n=1 Tax=Adineta steineri TaxID=433720 RepID=A0A815MS11_9BILA|nr:unnamed protein product [Adineta steineri]
MNPYLNPYVAKPNRYQNNANYKIRPVSVESRPVTINKQQYNFNKKIATGQFSSVYAAYRRSDNKPVAIKIIPAATKHSTEAANVMHLFLNEIQMAKRLATTSNHIIHIYDFDFDQRTGLSFIIMELGQQDLEKYLSQRNALTPDERKSIWRQLVNIAITLYNHRIMHLNISPENLVLFPGNLVKLGDFGMARKFQQSRTKSLGNPVYLAPELNSPYHKPTVTAKADIWSFGAILYRMTYMVPPHHNSPFFRPPLNQRSTNDPNLLNILQHTLVIDPNARPDALWLATHPYTKTS